MVEDNPLWIMADDPSWLTPMDARNTIEKVVGSSDEALLYLLDALKGGTVDSSGIPKIELTRIKDRASLAVPESMLERRLIPSSFWSDSLPSDERSWSWRGGTFKFSAAGISNYLDVGFSRVGVRALCDELRGERGEQTITIASADVPTLTEGDVGAVRKGGRNSDKHGEPIAELAIKLYNMDDEFSRYVGPVVEIELAQAYLRRRVSVPSESNLKGISLGILRAVRAARGRRA